MIRRSAFMLLICVAANKNIQLVYFSQTVLVLLNKNISSGERLKSFLILLFAVSKCSRKGSSLTPAAEALKSPLKAPGPDSITSIFCHLHDDGFKIGCYWPHDLKQPITMLKLLLRINYTENMLYRNIPST